MNENVQHTLKRSVNFEGVGLHTGISVKLNLMPAKVNTGFNFIRTDIDKNLLIPADCDLVTDTSRGTTITYNNTSVSTIEHLLAALVACGIDNCIIEIDGPEIPILDGSSYPFLMEIEKAGSVEQDAQKKWHQINEPIIFSDKEKQVDMILLPSNEYEIISTIDFNSEILGIQTAHLKYISEFKEQISQSRTFCFLHEVEFLLKNNLIKGGDLDNAIIIVNKALNKEESQYLAQLFNKPNIEVKAGYLNNLELRYNNEPARHKLLDIVGDLALSGINFKGKVIAIRPGHKTNIDFAKQIKHHIKSV